MEDNELRSVYADRFPTLEKLAQNLENGTKAALDGIPHIDRICFRVKALTSFLRKASAAESGVRYDAPLVEIEDQVAGRIITFFLSDLDSVIQRLKKTFTHVEQVYKRPERDAEFGYETHHFIFIIPPHLKPTGWEEVADHPNTFEMQVRTVFMHAYAEPQHDVAYKSAHELPPEIRRELAWIAATSWGCDRAYERVREWSLVENGRTKQDVRTTLDSADTAL